MVKNIIICGSGHGIRCVYRGLHKHGQNFVLCSPDLDLRAEASNEGIKCVNDYKDAIESSSDIVLTAAYKPKIEQFDLDKARFINIHYALLPRYRGMHAIVWAMLNGETHVGFTLHETSLLLDQGPIIYQASTPVSNYTSWELMLTIDGMVENTIHDVVDDYLCGKIIPKPQSNKEAIYVAPRNKEDCRVSWEKWNAIYFSRIIKALVAPYPLPFFEHRGDTIEILSAFIIFRDYVETNGHVVYLDDKYVYVKIPDGLLLIELIRINGVEIKAINYFLKIGIRLK